MIRRSISLAFALLCAVLCSCSSQEVTPERRPEIASIEPLQFITEQLQTRREEAKPTYDPNIDYMEQMVLCAVYEDFAQVKTLIDARNAKIIDLGLDAELLTAELFFDEFWKYGGFSLTADYYDGLITCVATNNHVSGQALTEELARKDAVLRIDRPQINFDDLYLLAKIIYSEAGSDWLSMEWKMKVGEVFLNRVASPEYPDTFRGVAYQPSQYAMANTRWFKNVVPNRASAEAAVRLMLGQRIICDPSVIFQANFTQGSAIYERLYDSKLGYTYLCHSNRMNLYEREEEDNAYS